MGLSDILMPQPPMSVGPVPVRSPTGGSVLTAINTAISTASGTIRDIAQSVSVLQGRTPTLQQATPAPAAIPAAQKNALLLVAVVGVVIVVIAFFYKGGK